VSWLITVSLEAALIANTWFWFAVLVAGFGYAVVGFVSNRFRFFVSIGAVGKISFFVFVTYLWFAGVATNVAAVIAFGDLLWGVYFLVFLYGTRQYGYV